VYFMTFLWRKSVDG